MTVFPQSWRVVCCEWTMAVYGVSWNVVLWCLLLANMDVMRLQSYVQIQVTGACKTVFAAGLLAHCIPAPTIKRIV